MNALNNHLTHSFLDDMADLGAFFWFRWALVAWLVGYAMQGVIPLSLTLGVIFAINLFVAGVVTVWWERRGREKYATTSIVDMGRAKQQQREE